MQTAPATANPADLHERKERTGFFQSRGWRRFLRYRPGVYGLGVIILLVLIAIFAPLLAPYDPNVGDTALRGARPSWDHLLGCDAIGRDMLSRLIYGSRVALIVGIGSTFIAVVIGVFFGAVSGYFGGWVDQALVADRRHADGVSDAGIVDHAGGRASAPVCRSSSSSLAELFGPPTPALSGPT